MKKMLFIGTLLLALVACEPKEDDNPVTSCTNQSLDGNETEVDCGGDCAACPEEVFVGRLGSSNFSPVQLNTDYNDTSDVLRIYGLSNNNIQYSLTFAGTGVGSSTPLAARTAIQGAGGVYEWLGGNDSASIIISANNTARKTISGEYYYYCTRQSVVDHRVFRGTFTDIRY